jgi:glutamate/tyrosine decarboxylase-like PLP-dependent enzyme
MSRERNDETKDLLAYGMDLIAEWEAQWSAFDPDPTLEIDSDAARTVVRALAERLRDNYPFFHPSYAGQMLKPPHPIAMVAYAMAQRINPNAHALDGGPATAHLEHEVVADLKRMFGYDPAASLGHLTSSGTIANLEALWVARESYPDKAIAYSSEAHYTHSRMCGVLGVEGREIPADAAGRMDLEALEAALRTGEIGTVVATAGTTSLGAVDPVDQIVWLAQAVGARVHVDAAYGGFFALLAHQSQADAALPPRASAAFRAIAQADSVVVDPHKHGLQPYGCGSVLFRDAGVGRFYKHDSPYTYFTSSELHLGEISLECSRAGAAAAALWATLQVVPLTADVGLGPVLRKTLVAARKWATLIESSDRLRLILEPELDIIGFYPLPADGDRRTSMTSALTQRMFADLMSDPGDPLYLATFQVSPSLLTNHDLTWDTDRLTAFRSVLMKPEHVNVVESLHRHVLDRLGAMEGTPDRRKS